MIPQIVDKGISPDSGENSRRASLTHRRQLREKRGSGLRKSKSPCAVCHRHACQCAHHV